MMKEEDSRIVEFVGVVPGDGSINRTYQNRLQITLSNNEVSYREYVALLT